jgi:hypothetical protein
MTDLEKPVRQRSLKIEAIGDFAYRKIKPRIRLSGHWLEKAGFKPGHRAVIHVEKPGELTLRFEEQMPINSSTENFFHSGGDESGVYRAYSQSSIGRLVAERGGHQSDPRFDPGRPVDED